MASSIWVFADAPQWGLSRWNALATLLLWIVCFPLYLSDRSKAKRESDTRGFIAPTPTPYVSAEPELLGNGDILVPIANDTGGTKMMRLGVGEEGHAEWLAYLQRYRR